ncbi:MAG TPA: NAD(P)-dependent oxidoreductase [Beijerinckiaceae bacterium]|nr:NAD(P)-dependent oxidoreductase [Beijerinckiaceae bacterium]
MTRKPQRLLITGAAGMLGKQLRRRLAGEYALLRLSDVASMEPAGAGEETVVCDLADREGVGRLCEGIDAIVHLGGRATEADWDTVHSANILGAIHLYEGARKAKVERVLFASSNHAVGLVRRTPKTDHTASARPDSRYGLSKAFGEDIAALYAYKHGVRAYCMRIGSCFPEPTDERMLSSWLSYDDFERLVRTGLAADYTYEIVYGISRNTRAWWDNSNAYRLGYNPQDNAEAFAPRLTGVGVGNPLHDPFIGGGYVSPDFEADPWKIP